MKHLVRCSNRKPFWVVLTLSILSGWTIRQLNVNNAFLHGHLREPFYMKQPHSFIHLDFPDHVCRFKKAIYDLKQVPRAWFQCLINTLIFYGFRASKAESSLFIYQHNSFTVLLLVYGDDIIVCSSDWTHLQGLIHHLSFVFPMKDLGDQHFFLGIEACRHNHGMLLSQLKYVSKLLRRFDHNNIT